MTTIAGFMNLDELRKLEEWARRYDSVVEVGSWKGASTVYICEGCKGKVYAVDHFKGSADPEDGTHTSNGLTKDTLYEEFLENTKGYTNLEVLKMDSLEAAKRFEPRSVDMVFLDAGHEYAEIKADLQAWGPVAKKWLCGHDLYIGGVRQALEELGIKYQSVGFRYPWTMWFAPVQEVAA